MVFVLILKSNIVMASLELFARAPPVSPGNSQDYPRSQRYIYSHPIHAWNAFLIFFQYLAAFAAVSASYHTASTKINSGVSDPSEIFAEGHEQVVDAWKGLEVSRKTMTYLPYKY